MGLGGCYGVIKFLVVLVNFIFWLVGLASLVLVIWMLVDPTFYVSMAQDKMNYDIVLYISLVAAILMLVVAFFGCCGAYRESRCMLVSFFTCLLIIFVGSIAAGTWAYYNSNKLESLVRLSVKTTVEKEYGVSENTARTFTFDAIQSGLECCGADGPDDWASSRYQSEPKLDLGVSSVGTKYTIPASCCKNGVSNVECDAARVLKPGSTIPNAIYRTGCIEVLFDTIRQQSTFFLVVGCTLAALEFLGLIFSCVLCYAIKRTDRYKA